MNVGGSQIGIESFKSRCQTARRRGGGIERQTYHGSDGGAGRRRSSAGERQGRREDLAAGYGEWSGGPDRGAGRVVEGDTACAGGSSPILRVGSRIDDVDLRGFRAGKADRGVAGGAGNGVVRRTCGLGERTGRTQRGHGEREGRGFYTKHVFFPVLDWTGASPSRRRTDRVTGSLPARDGFCGLNELFAYLTQIVRHALETQVQASA